jgi:aldehyde:ferredoxin oxidoreductase
MPDGFWGKVLFVDLSTRQVWEEKPSLDVYRQYFGGYGLGVRYLYEQIPSRADPLGLENILAFGPVC